VFLGLCGVSFFGVLICARVKQTHKRWGKHSKGSCDDALPKDAYVCKKCDYVLLKEDAFVSGYDS
jgi:hypothetical protein